MVLFKLKAQAEDRAHRIFTFHYGSIQIIATS